MTAFRPAIDAMFRDRNMAADALWRPGGADPAVSVRVITRAPDRMTNFSDGRFVSESILLDVRTSEVDMLHRGDTFEIGDRVYEVRSDPVRDVERLVWAAEVRDLG